MAKSRPRPRRGGSEEEEEEGEGRSGGVRKGTNEWLHQTGGGREETASSLRRRRRQGGDSSLSKSLSRGGSPSPRSRSRHRDRRNNDEEEEEEEEDAAAADGAKDDVDRAILEGLIGGVEEARRRLAALTAISLRHATTARQTSTALGGAPPAVPEPHRAPPTAQSPAEVRMKHGEVSPSPAQRLQASLAALRSQMDNEEAASRYTHSVTGSLCDAARELQSSGRSEVHLVREELREAKRETAAIGKECVNLGSVLKAAKQAMEKTRESLVEAEADAAGACRDAHHAEERARTGEEALRQLVHEHQTLRGEYTRSETERLDLLHNADSTQAEAEEHGSALRDAIQGAGVLAGKVRELEEAVRESQREQDSLEAQCKRQSHRLLDLDVKNQALEEQVRGLEAYAPNRAVERLAQLKAGDVGKLLQTWRWVGLVRETIAAKRCIAAWKLGAREAFWRHRNGVQKVAARKAASMIDQLNGTIGELNASLEEITQTVTELGGVHHAKASLEGRLDRQRRRSRLFATGMLGRQARHYRLTPLRHAVRRWGIYMRLDARAGLRAAAAQPAVPEQEAAKVEALRRQVAEAEATVQRLRAAEASRRNISPALELPASSPPRGEDRAAEEWIKESPVAGGVPVGSPAARLELDPTTGRLHYSPAGGGASATGTTALGSPAKGLLQETRWEIRRLEGLLEQERASHRAARDDFREHRELLEEAVSTLQSELTCLAESPEMEPEARKFRIAELQELRVAAKAGQSLGIVAPQLEAELNEAKDRVASFEAAAASLRGEAEAADLMREELDLRLEEETEKAAELREEVSHWRGVAEQAGKVAMEGSEYDGKLLEAMEARMFQLEREIANGEAKRAALLWLTGMMRDRLTVGKGIVVRLQESLQATVSRQSSQEALAEGSSSRERELSEQIQRLQDERKFQHHRLGAIAAGRFVAGGSRRREAQQRALSGWCSFVVQAALVRVARTQMKEANEAQNAAVKDAEASKQEALDLQSKLETLRREAASTAGEAASLRAVLDKVQDVQTKSKPSQESRQGEKGTEKPTASAEAMSPQEASIQADHILLQAAMQKFSQLDTNGNGALEGSELEDLAEWALKLFCPGLVMTPEIRKVQAAKILHRCDKDKDNQLEEAEFSAYFQRLYSTVLSKGAAQVDLAEREPNKAPGPNHDTGEASKELVDLRQALSQEQEDHEEDRRALQGQLRRQNQSAQQTVVEVCRASGARLMVGTLTSSRLKPYLESVLVWLGNSKCDKWRLENASLQRELTLRTSGGTVHERETGIDEKGEEGGEGEEGEESVLRVNRLGSVTKFAQREIAKYGPLSGPTWRLSPQAVRTPPPTQGGDTNSSVSPQGRLLTDAKRGRRQRPALSPMLDMIATESAMKKLHNSARGMSPALVDASPGSYASIHKAQENLAERMARLRRMHGVKGSPGPGAI